MKVERKTVQSIFLAFIFVFVVIVFSKQYRSISFTNLSLNKTGLSFAILFYLIAVIFQALIWNQLIAFIENKKYQLKTLLAIYIPSWLASYIPGKVGSVGYKLILGKRKNIGRVAILFASLSEIIIYIFLGFLVSAPILYTYKTVLSFSQIILFAILALFILVLFFNSKNFFAILNKLNQRFNKNGSEIKFNGSYQKIALPIFEYLLVHVIYGIGFYFFVNSVQNITHLNLLFLISSWAFAQVIGMVTLISPSGIGIKEGVLTFLLQTHLPLDIAIAISIASRLWTIISDILIYLIFLTCNQFIFNRNHAN